MNIIRSVLFYLFVVITFVVGGSMTYVVSLVIRPATRTFQWVACRWSRLLLFVTGVGVRVAGRENVPQGESVIYVSNHQGAADIPILLASLPTRFRFVIKKELFTIPFFGWYLRMAGYLCVDRGAADKAHNFMTEAVGVLKSGENLLIFPEGTRSGSPELGEFKRGSLLLAFKAKVKIVPVAVSGSYQIKPWPIIPAQVEVKIGQPISLEKYGTKFDVALEDIQNIIKNMLLA